MTPALLARGDDPPRPPRDGMARGDDPPQTPPRRHGPGGRPPGTRRAGGAWIGLTLAHERDDLMRAALEGVAFLLRGKLDDMRAAGCAPARIRLAGGGTRHPAWRQLLADVLAVPLYPAGSGWLTASGAALISAAATGLMTWARTPDRSGEEGEVVAGASQLAEASYRRFRSSASQYSL
jgi:sugar (pentulose or hexulose) kinase